jgi:hypothetical protein
MIPQIDPLAIAAATAHGPSMTMTNRAPTAPASATPRHVRWPICHCIAWTQVRHTARAASGAVRWAARMLTLTALTNGETGRARTGPDISAG